MIAARLGRLCNVIDDEFLRKRDPANGTQLLIRLCRFFFLLFVRLSYEMHTARKSCPSDPV
jgi:hypothetical protein